MTIEEIRAMPGTYFVFGFTTGQMCAFWDGETPDQWLIARYSHSEKTTPFDRHWTMGGDYFANIGEVEYRDLPYRAKLQELNRQIQFAKTLARVMDEGCNK